MSYTRAGIRFSNESYILVDAENPPAPVIEPAGIDLDMRDYIKQMRAGETYQIVYSLIGNAKAKFESNASSSKIRVSDSGLLTCIGNTTGFCMITIKAVDPDDETIILSSVKTKVEVIS